MPAGFMPFLFYFTCQVAQIVPTGGQENIPAKPFNNHDIVSVHFNNLLLHRDLRQTKEGPSYVHLQISQCGWVLINIFYDPAKIKTPNFA